MREANRYVLSEAAASLWRSGIVVLVLLAIGSVVVGQALATTETCSVGFSGFPDCETTTNQGVAWTISIAYFVSGLVVLYPLYFSISRVLGGLVHVSRGLEDLQDALAMQRRSGK